MCTAEENGATSSDVTDGLAAEDAEEEQKKCLFTVNPEFAEVPVANEENDMQEVPQEDSGKFINNHKIRESQRVQLSDKIEIVETPQRAFIINIRRLMEMREKILMLHSFIDSTAIAALTLVAGGSWSQATFTAIF